MNKLYNNSMVQYDNTITNPCDNKRYKDFCAKYNITLNEQQSEAVQSIDGANLLLAVPGSGKTTVLVVRLGYMVICKKIKPQNILSMTYTKAATEDMRNRFSSLFGDELGKQLEFRTINGIADIAIKLYSKKKQRTAFELIPDEKRRMMIIRDVLQKVQDDYPTDSEVSDAATVISYIKNMMLSDDEIDGLKSDIPQIKNIYKMYCQTLVSNCLMDYDDQLVYAYKIFKSNPDILGIFHRRYNYICVDEAQDTSKIQHEIIKLLTKKTNNIFMVGDEDQSIYGFRAAYPQALVNFKKDYPNATILFMERNYRSTAEIVEVANGFIKRNLNRYNKNMVAERKERAPIEQIKVLTREEQYNFVLDIAQNATEETAILYRDNESVIPLIDMFLRKKIPYRTPKVKNTFFTHKVVRDVCAFLKLALNPFDTESFMQIYYKCGYALKKENAKYSCEQSKRENIPVADALVTQFSQNPKLLKKAEDFKFLLRAISLAKTTDAIDLIYSSGYNRFMKRNNLGYEKIELLKVLAKQEYSIKTFLSRLDELNGILSSDRTENNCGVILSTIHSSKGLEYDTVYLIDVFDGILPSIDMTTLKDSKENMDAYQEERRLFYVAMTRAKNKLYLFNVTSKKTIFINEVLSIVNRLYVSVETTLTTSQQKNVVFQERNKKLRDEYIQRQEQRKAAEKASREKGYEEVKELFTQQEEPIRDSSGRRWIECKICGKFKPAEEFLDYGGIGEVNLGVCSECNKKK